MILHHWPLCLLVLTLLALLQPTATAAAADQANEPDAHSMETLGRSPPSSCSWVTGSWGSCSCSNRCGTGSMKRSVSCQCTGRGGSGRCSGPPPDSSKPCEERSGCKPQCQYTPWGLCDAQCKTRSRLGSCMLGPFVEPNARKCGGCDDTTQACPVGAPKKGGGVCGPKCKWQVQDLWTDCSKSCGGGTQTRKALCVADTCRNYAEAEGLARRGNPCDGRCSEAEKPQCDRPCNTQSCGPKCKWQVQDVWTDCSKTCGGGTQTRKALCVADTCRNFAEAEGLARKGNPCDGRCRDSDKPQCDRPCNTPPCGPKCKWQAQDTWGQCSKPCGGGTQSRNALCVVDTCRNYAEAEGLVRKPNPCNGRCDDADKPECDRPCNTDSCAPPKCKLVVDPNFGPCSVKCGGGIKTRNSYCILDSTAPEQIESLIAGTSRPSSNPCAGMCANDTAVTSKPCNTGPCGPQKVKICESDVARQDEDSAPTKSWVIYTRPGGDSEYGGFRNGPGIPFLGTGSYESQTPGSGSKVTLFNFDHAEQLLSSISAILYTTFRSAGSAVQVASINIQIDTNGLATPGGFSTLVYEPVYNGPPALADGVWQQWDAYKGGAAIWWSSNPINGAPNRDTFVPFSTLVALNPGTVILGVGINQGSGNPGLISAVDYFQFTSGYGAYTYNFEACPKFPSPPPPTTPT